MTPLKTTLSQLSLILAASTPGFAAGWTELVGAGPINAVAISQTGRKYVIGTPWSAENHKRGMSGYGYSSFTNVQGVACSAGGQRIVAVCGGPQFKGRIHISTNSGASWHQTTAPLTNWIAVACSADGQRMIAATYRAGLYFSTNGGLTWTGGGDNNGQAGNPTRERNSVAMSADGNTWLAALLPYDGISVACSPNGQVLVKGPRAQLCGPQCDLPISISTNAGFSWFSPPSPVATHWTAVACTDDGKIAATTGGAVLLSTNLGATWDHSTGSTAWESSLAFSADGNTLLAGGTGSSPSWLWEAGPPSPFVVPNFTISNSNAGVLISWRMDSEYDTLHVQAPGYSVGTNWDQWYESPITSDGTNFQTIIDPWFIYFIPKAFFRLR